LGTFCKGQAMKTLVVIAVAVGMVWALSGCQQQGHRPFSQIQPGLSASEVIALVGAPATHSATRLTFKDAYFDKTLVVPLKDGKVAGEPGLDPPDVPTP